MPENASLSDYLFRLRRHVAPARLALLVVAGACITAAGMGFGPKFAWLAGLGMMVCGICGWAWVNHEADSIDVAFTAEPSKRARSLRAAGVAALGVAAIGTLIFLSAFAMRFVLLTKGM